MIPILIFFVGILLSIYITTHGLIIDFFIVSSIVSHFLLCQ